MVLWNGGQRAWGSVGSRIAAGQRTIFRVKVHGVAKVAISQPDVEILQPELTHPIEGGEVRE